MSFPDFLRLLSRRKLVLAFAAAAGGIIAVAIAHVLPLRYSSEALLLLESREPLNSDLTPAASPGPDRIRTEADILQSRAIVEGVVRSLRLAGNPDLDPASRLPAGIDRVIQATRRQAATALAYVGVSSPSATSHEPVGRDTGGHDTVGQAIDAIQRRLELKYDDRSHVVSVRFAAGTPTLAASVVNALLDRYIAEQSAARQDAAQADNRWQSTRLAALLQDVKDADHAVQEFRASHKLLQLNEGSLATLQANAEHIKLSAARDDLARMQASLEVARSGSFGANSEALASPVIQRDRDRESEILQRIASLQNRLGDKHPSVLAAESELQGVRRQIESETRKVGDSLRGQVEIARSRVQEAERAAAAAQNSAGASAADEGLAADLARDADAKRQVYGTFLARAQQIQLAQAQLPPARVVSPAVPAERPDGSPTSVFAVFGVFAGLFLVAGGSITHYLLQGRVGSAQELASLTGLSNLGTLPMLSGRNRQGMPSHVLESRSSGTIETLRALRIALQGMVASGAPVSALITSSAPGDGKTTLAASLSRLCASDGMRVLLVEADLRRPRLAATLKAWPNSSLEALLSGSVGFEDALYVDPRSGLHCLLADGSADSPLGLLESARFAELIGFARRRYQLVIIDSPPVMRVPDPILLSAHSDVILFAVVWEQTPRRLVEESIRRFPADKRSRIVTVLTRVRPSRMDAQGYYEGYARKLALPALRT